MAKKKQAASSDNAQPQAGRTRSVRKFPALTFEAALVLPEAIQKYGAGQKVRRLTLFEKLNQPPDGAKARRLITGAGQYGLTKGSYTAEYLELTPNGMEATGEEVAPAKKLESRFNLAIQKVEPFNFLFEKIQGNKLPATEVMADYLTEIDVEEDEKAECIDTFIVNAKFLGLLRTIGGSERLITLPHAIDEAPSIINRQEGPPSIVSEYSALPLPSSASPIIPGTTTGNTDFSKTCFYISPIGDDGSEQRRHSDFLMEYIIAPALKEFNMKLVRADQMGKPGMIGKQVIEHIIKSRLVVADLSFHNPNVFYELCLRHATRLPTVQIIRAADKIPFDLNQYTTIQIETRDPYTLVPKIQTYIAEVSSQVRRALEDEESGDNPISLYYPTAKLVLEPK
jgi:hypothetical protein